MKNFPRLTNPPIVEAIIDIRFSVPDSFELEQLRPVAESFYSESLPHWEERKRGEANIEIRTDDGQVKVNSADPILAQFVRSDKDGDKKATQTLLWSRDSITVSHTPPYRSWDKIFEVAHGMFSEFVKITSPQKVDLPVKSGGASGSLTATGGPYEQTGTASIY